MIAEVNQETCIDCEVCKSICSEVFKMKVNGLTQIATELTSGKIKDFVMEAKKNSSYILSRIF
nr:ferredoxin [uncultured Marinifilum sp.]